MKLTLIIISSLIAITAIAQFTISKSTSDTEQHKYKVLKKIDDIEIRKYEKALFTKVDMNSNSYRAVSRNGFRVLAGYIFGDNERNQKIAMTSPVTMTLDSVSEMRFMVPSNMKKKNLPEPNNKDIEFIEEDSKIMAAIQFSGWANDEKIERYKSKLIKELELNNITHKGNFSYLGYNPPYEVVNRRNEIVVELTNF